MFEQILVYDPTIRKQNAISRVSPTWRKPSPSVQLPLSIRLNYPPKWFLIIRLSGVLE